MLNPRPLKKPCHSGKDARLIVHQHGKNVLFRLPVSHDALTSNTNKNPPTKARMLLYTEILSKILLTPLY